MNMKYLHSIVAKLSKSNSKKELAENIEKIVRHILANKFKDDFDRLIALYEIQNRLLKLENELSRKI